MSNWTHIRGSIFVSVPGNTQAQIDYIIHTILEHLPVVSGSEGDMQVFPIQMGGHNSYSTADEYGMRTNNLIDDRYLVEIEHRCVLDCLEYGLVVG